MKLESEELDETVVALDPYNSDLNLVLSASRYAAHPLTNEGFAFMWAGVRATHGFAKGKTCYEVKIVENLDVSHLPSDEPNPHVVRVGFSVESSTLQLGEDPLSYGYGGTGKISTNCQFKDFGGPFVTGDVILAMLNMDSDQAQIGYAKNGRFLGWAYRINKYELKGQALFPHILTKNVSFEVNFGQKDKPYFPLPDNYKDFTFINCTPVEIRVAGTRAPKRKEDCEMIMMCGLPGAGKSVWAADYSLKHPEKKYNVLGTNNIIDKMKVMGLPRKRNYAGRWDVLIQMATKCLNKMFEIGSKLKRNYILDQTNVYPNAQRRKMKNFQGFKRLAVVVVPSEEEYKRRCDKRDREEGKEVPDSAVNEMKANFKLPEKNDVFDEVIYTELQREAAEKLVHIYNEDGKAATGPPRKQFRSEPSGFGNRGYESNRGNFNSSRGGPQNYGGRGGYEDKPASYDDQGGYGGHGGNRGGYDSRGGRGGYDKNRGGYGGGRGGYEGGRGGFEGGRGSYEGSRGGFDRSRGGYEGGRGGRSGYESGRGGYEGGRGGYESGRGGYEGGRGGYESGRGGYESGRGGYESGRGGYESGRGGYEGGRGSFERGRGGRGGYEGGRNEYDRGHASYEGGRSSYDGNRSTSYGGNQREYDAPGGYQATRSGYDDSRGTKRGFDDGRYDQSPSGGGSPGYGNNSQGSSYGGGSANFGNSRGFGSSRGSRGRGDFRGAQSSGNQGSGGFSTSSSDQYSGRSYQDSSSYDKGNSSYGGRGQRGGQSRGSTRGNASQGGNSNTRGFSRGGYGGTSDYSHDTSSGYGSSYGDYQSDYSSQSQSGYGSASDTYSKGSMGYRTGTQSTIKKEPGIDNGSRFTPGVTRPSGRTTTRWSAEEPQRSSSTQDSSSYPKYGAQVKTEPPSNPSYDAYSGQSSNYPSYGQSTQGSSYPSSQSYGYQQSSAATAPPTQQWASPASATPAAPATQGTADQTQWSQYYQQPSQPNQYYGQYYGQQTMGSAPNY